MKPYFVEIKDSETQESIIVDMEGPYHHKKERTPVRETRTGVLLFYKNMCSNIPGY